MNPHLRMEYIFFLFVFLYQYGTRLSYLNQCDEQVRSKIIPQKSSLIILPEMCNVTDYITDYNFCHVVWNQ